MSSALRNLARWSALSALALLLIVAVPLNALLSVMNGGTLGVVAWAADRWHELRAA